MARDKLAAAITTSPSARTSRAVRSWRLVGMALVLALVTSACSLPGRGPANGYDYTGTWRGALVGDDGQSGTMSVTFDQAAYQLSGTWHAVITTGTATNETGGAWSADVYVGQDNDLLEAKLTPARSGACSYTLTLARRADTLRGSYAQQDPSADCGAQGIGRGTVQLSKQP